MKRIHQWKLNDQYEGEDSSDVLTGPTTEGDSMRLHSDFYHKYSEHKELAQYIWEAMHTKFTLASISAIFSQLPIRKDGEINEMNTLKR